MRFEALKVGELARRTGLTIRTLHHYDEIGLRNPTSSHHHPGRGARTHRMTVPRTSWAGKVCADWRSLVKSRGRRSRH